MRLLITGTSTGIGNALAKHLLTQGHDIWGIARSEQGALARDFPGKFRFSQADVSLWAEMDRARQHVEGSWDSLDGIIACAGLQGAVGPTLTIDPQHWSNTVRANLDGTFFTIRAFYPILSRSMRRRKVVCFSGGGATKARAHFSAYGVAKTGVVRLVETIAEETRNEPLDINAIAPGAINTRLTDEVIALGPERAGRAEYESAVKQKASGGASLTKALGLVEWLLSAESDGITGKLISAPWDPWPTLAKCRERLMNSDIYSLRRIVPEERGERW